MSAHGVLTPGGVSAQGVFDITGVWPHIKGFDLSEVRPHIGGFDFKGVWPHIGGFD